MRTRIINKLNMYHTVSSVCETHASVWNTIPAFGQNYQLFLAKVAALEQEAYQHTQSLVGVTESKEVERKTAIEKAQIVASALRSLGSVSADTKLMAQLRFPQTRLLQAGATRLIQYLDSIIEAAGNHLTELPDYGISQYKIDELIQVRDQLTVTLGTPRNAIITRKILTDKLDQLTGELDHLLKDTLDELVLVLKPDYPEFANLYKAARVIVDQKGKSNKPKPPLPPTVKDE